MTLAGQTHGAYSVIRAAIRTDWGVTVVALPETNTLASTGLFANSVRAAVAGAHGERAVFTSPPRKTTAVVWGGTKSSQ